MRAYERGDERWEVELREQCVVTRRFAGGALVDDATQTHASPLRAKWDADRFCSRLAHDGFVRVGADDAPLGKTELEDALRANPDDLETYLVYADWLSEQGDDWGQLIAVQHAQQTSPRFGPERGRDAVTALAAAAARRDELGRTEDMLMFRLASRLWGELGETIHDEQRQRYLYELIDVTWFCGFLRSARIVNGDDRVFGELLRHLHALPIALVLRELVIDAGAWEPGTLELVTERTWASLETLAIDGDADAARVVPVLSRAPKLRHLSVGGTTNSDALCRAIAASPIVSQLESLALRQADITGIGIDALSTAKLRSLKTLDLGATPPGAHARLQHLAPTVRVHLDG